MTPELAQELLEASDQYMLDTLKRLCEIKIAEELQPDNVSQVSPLGESLGGTCWQSKGGSFLVCWGYGFFFLSSGGRISGPPAPRSDAYSMADMGPWRLKWCAGLGCCRRHLIWLRTSMPRS